MSATSAMPISSRPWSSERSSGASSTARWSSSIPSWPRGRGATTRHRASRPPPDPVCSPTSRAAQVLLLRAASDPRAVLVGFRARARLGDGEEADRGGGRRVSPASSRRSAAWRGSTRAAGSAPRPRAVGDDERLVDARPSAGSAAAGSGHPPARPRVEAAAERAEAAEHDPVRRVEQVVAPGDRRGERLLAAAAPRAPRTSSPKRSSNPDSMSRGAASEFSGRRGLSSAPAACRRAASRQPRAAPVKSSSANWSRWPGCGA